MGASHVSSEGANTVIAVKKTYGGCGKSMEGPEGDLSSPIARIQD